MTLTVAVERLTNDLTGRSTCTCTEADGTVHRIIRVYDTDLSIVLAEVKRLKAGNEWRPIESAPPEGQFLGWHNGHNEARTVRRFNIPGKPNAVINDASGIWFVPTRWRPLLTAPGTKELGDGR